MVSEFTWNTEQMMEKHDGWAASYSCVVLPNSQDCTQKERESVKGKECPCKMPQRQTGEIRAIGTARASLIPDIST